MNDAELEQMGDLPHPLANLKTSVLTVNDTVKGLTWAINNLTDWGSVCMCWSWGTTAFICNASIRQIYYGDVMCDEAHGPETNNVIAKKMSCLILRKGDRHKDRFQYDRVIGAWRHRNFLMCPTGILAMHTMMHFFQLGSTGNISFDLQYQRHPCFWQNLPIVKYGYETSEKSIQPMLQ